MLLRRSCRIYSALYTLCLRDTWPWGRGISDHSVYSKCWEHTASVAVSSSNSTLYAVPIEMEQNSEQEEAGSGSSCGAGIVAVSSGNSTLYAVPMGIAEGGRGKKLTEYVVPSSEQMDVYDKAKEEQRQQENSPQARFDADGYVDDAFVNCPQGAEYAIAVVDGTVEYAPSTERQSSAECTAASGYCGNSDA